MGVCFEPRSCFYGRVAKFKEKLSFSTYFSKTVHKSYEKQHVQPFQTAHYDPKNVVVEKTWIAVGEKPNFSIRAPKLKAIKHWFWHFSWTSLGLP